jgi:hypothetical protein
MKKLYLLLTLGLCVLTLVSCSKSNGMDGSASMGQPAVTTSASFGSAISPDGTVNEDTTVDVSTRKLIRDVDLQIETKGFDTLIADLDAKVAAMNGYVESSNISGTAYETAKKERSAQIVYRIPASKVDEFLSHVGENANILQKNEKTQDVTLTYVDLESRIKTLAAEKDALTELLAKANSTDAILSIRSQLNDVIYRYESAMAQLRALSDQVDYSTITMNIQEVIEYTEAPKAEQSRWEKLSQGFVRSCKDVGNGFLNVFTFLLINLPHLLVWGGIITGVIFFFRYRKKRKLRKIMSKNDSNQAK